jgi:hypothetical protein
LKEWREFDEDSEDDEGGEEEEDGEEEEEKRYWEQTIVRVMAERKKGGVKEVDAIVASGKRLRSSA